MTPGSLFFLGPLICEQAVYQQLKGVVKHRGEQDRSRNVELKATYSSGAKLHSGMRSKRGIVDGSPLRLWRQ
jgi:hypothetical protein